MTEEHTAPETLNLPVRLTPGSPLGTVVDATGAFIARAASRELGKAMVDALNTLTPTEAREVCAHCGREITEASGYARIGGLRVCHPGDADGDDCLRLVTVYGEVLGARRGRGEFALPEPVTPERLREIEERHANATPGPWWSEEDAETFQLHGYDRGAPPQVMASRQIFKAAKTGTPYAEYWPVGGDRDFIAHAWSDVRDLLAARRVDLSTFYADVRQFIRDVDLSAFYADVRRLIIEYGDGEMIAEMAFSATLDQVASERYGIAEGAEGDRPERVECDVPDHPAQYVRGRLPDGRADCVLCALDEANAACQAAEEAREFTLQDRNSLHRNWCILSERLMFIQALVGVISDESVPADVREAARHDRDELLLKIIAGEAGRDEVIAGLAPQLAEVEREYACNTDPIECGHEAARGEAEEQLRQMTDRLEVAEERLARARTVLVAEGYFRDREIGPDLAPHLIERLSVLKDQAMTARVDERRKLIKLFERAAVGRRAQLISDKTLQAKPSLAEVNERLKMSAACYDSVVQLLRDPHAIMDIVPSWQWTEEETASLYPPAEVHKGDD